MTRNQAYAILPADAVWSSSFGYPGEDGFSEYYRQPDGTRWNVSRSFKAYDVWTCAKLTNVRRVDGVLVAS